MVFRDRILACLAVVVVALSSVWLGVGVADAAPTPSVPQPRVPSPSTSISATSSATGSPSPEASPSTSLDPSGSDPSGSDPSNYSDGSEDLEDMGPDQDLGSGRGYWILGGAVAVAAIAGLVVALIKR